MGQEQRTLWQQGKRAAETVLKLCRLEPGGKESPETAPFQPCAT